MNLYLVKAKFLQTLLLYIYKASFPMLFFEIKHFFKRWLCNSELFSLFSS